MISELGAISGGLEAERQRPDGASRGKVGTDPEHRAITAWERRGACYFPGAYLGKSREENAKRTCLVAYMLLMWWEAMTLVG